MIIFGFSSFLINSYSIQELGINIDEDYDGILYEHREYYLHIFYIPFVTLGKRWLIYKNAEYYNSPISYTKEAKKMGFNTSMRWYANIGIILLALFYFSYIIVSKYSSYNATKDTEAREILITKENKDKILHPEIGDLYNLSFLNACNLNSMMVHNLSNDSILFAIKDLDQPQPVGSINNDKIEESALKYIWVSKRELLKVIEEYSVISVINSTNELKISEINRHNLYEK